MTSASVDVDTSSECIRDNLLSNLSKKEKKRTQKIICFELRQQMLI